MKRKMSILFSISFILGQALIFSSCAQNKVPLYNYEPLQYELIIPNVDENFEKLDLRRDLYVEGDFESETEHINSLYGELTSTYSFTPLAESFDKTLELRFPYVLPLYDLDNLSSIELKCDDLVLEPNVILSGYEEDNIHYQYPIDEYYQMESIRDIAKDDDVFTYYSYTNKTKKTQKLDLLAANYDFKNGLVVIEKGKVDILKTALDLSLTSELKKGETCSFFIKGEIDVDYDKKAYKNNPSDLFEKKMSSLSFKDYLSLANEKYGVSALIWKSAMNDAKMLRNYNSFGIEEEAIKTYLDLNHLVILSYEFHIDKIDDMVMTLKRPVYLGFTSSYRRSYTLDLGDNFYQDSNLNISKSWYSTYINLSSFANDRFLPINENIVLGTTQDDHQYYLEYSREVEIALKDEAEFSSFTVFDTYTYVNADIDTMIGFILGVIVFLGMILILIYYTKRQRLGGKKHG